MNPRKARSHVLAVNFGMVFMAFFLGHPDIVIFLGLVQGLIYVVGQWLIDREEKEHGKT